MSNCMTVSDSESHYSPRHGNRHILEYKAHLTHMEIGAASTLEAVRKGEGESVRLSKGL